MAARLKEHRTDRQSGESYENRVSRACVVTNWTALVERLRSALAPADVVVQSRLADLMTYADCDLYVIDTKIPDMRLWPAPMLSSTAASRLWLFLVASPADLRRVCRFPANSLVFDRNVEALDQLVRYLQARSDPEAGRRFASVDYLENLRMLLVKLENGSMYLLKLDELPEADRSAMLRLGIDRGKHHFSVIQESGNSFEVPWDDVLYHCEPGYEFYKGRALAKVDGDRSKRIGEQVRAVREEKGLTVSELAERAGMRRPNVSRLEHGRHSPSLETLERIAEALDVPVAQLIARTDRPERKWRKRELESPSEVPRAASTPEAPRA